MKPTISAIVLVLPMSASLPAAPQTERDSESRDSSTQGVSASAHLLVTSGENARGGTVGVTALGRYEWLTAGLIAETGFAALEYDLVYENDVTRERVAGTNTQTGGPYEVEVGDGRLGAGLVLGGVFDL
jgi:hypothetical protein